MKTNLLTMVCTMGIIGNVMASGAEESEVTAIEAGFGKVAVNVKAPGLAELWLREADGTLAAKNVLSLHPPMHDWKKRGQS